MNENKKDVEKLKLFNLAIRNSQAYEINIEVNEKISIFIISVLKKEMEIKKDKMTEQNRDKVINQILISIQETNKSIQNLSSKVDKLENNVNNLNSNYQKLNSKIDDLEFKMNNLETKINNLEVKFDKLESKLDQHIVESEINFKTLFSITKDLQDQINQNNK